MTGEMGVALDLMRLEGICKMLLESLEADELETKFLAVTGQQKVENIKSSLLKLTKAELRRIVELSPTITESVIKKYYNEYRYGRKPGFVLFWASGFIGKSINEEQLKNDLQRVLSDKTYKEDAKFKDLKCVAATSWIEGGSTVFEIGLSYLMSTEQTPVFFAAPKYPAMLSKLAKGRTESYGDSARGPTWQSHEQRFPAALQ